MLRYNFFTSSNAGRAREKHLWKYARADLQSFTIQWSALSANLTRIFVARFVIMCSSTGIVCSQYDIAYRDEEEEPH